MTQSAQLQREAALQREGLSSTLGQLRDGMTTQALSAELVGVLRDSSLSVVKSLAESARGNPGAALLIGAGLTMMLTRTTSADVVSTASSTFRAATAAGGDAIGAAAATARNATMRAGEEASSLTDKLIGAVGDTAASVKDRAGGALDSLSEEAASRGRDAQGFLEQGKDQARHLNEEAAKLANDTRLAMTRLLEDQPILVAAIGTAIGALFGAALPLSQTERDLLSKMGSEAIGTGREVLEKAKEVATEEFAKAELGKKVAEGAGKVIDGMVPTSPHT